MVTAAAPLSTIYHFAGDAIAEVWDSERTIRVTLPGGAQVHGVPHTTDVYLKRALSLGYAGPDPSWLMCREHEMAHCYLAELRDLKESPTLRDVAENRAREHIGDHAVPGYQWQEEGEVLALQWYFNSGDRSDDPKGTLSALAWEFDLSAAREEFIRRFRQAN